MPASEYQKPLYIPLQDIDAAGIVFFAHLFRYAHEAYEHFMEQVGFPLPERLKDGQILIPIVHSEADFQRPLRHGDKLKLCLKVKRLGDSSFTLATRIVNHDEHTLATVETVHVTVDANSLRPTPLPASLQRALSPYNDPPAV